MKNQKEEKNDSFFSEKTGKILSISGIVIIIITIFSYLINGNWEYSWTFDEAIIGQFGDFIGGFIGSLFSLAGVILFYVALKEQRKDISINQKNIELQTSALEQQVKEFQAQKTELEETRKVYEEQTILIREQTNLYRQQNKELKEQSNISKNQQFDSSFFSYLSLLNEYRNNLNKLSNSGNYFGDILNEVKEQRIDENSIRKILDLVCEKYLDVFELHRDKMAPYFKTLYRIMMLIDSSNIDLSKKIEYFKLLRSQFSDVELLILNYNYHTDLGIKVRALIIKYNFLKHINLFDKIEFTFTISNKCKTGFVELLKFNEALIIDGIENYKNIENDEDIDKSYLKKFLGLDVEVKLTIKDDFQFSLTFLNEELNTHNELNEELIKNLIKRHLYTVLYVSKYSRNDETEISVSKIETDDKTQFLYKINNLDSL
ncbi:putative phage abortive infection protein [Paenimyroides ceti]